MNDRVRAGAAAGQLADLHAAQRLAFEAQPCPSAQERRAHLQALKRQLLRHQDELAAAIARDFGWRSTSESLMLDVLPTVLEIDHLVAHVRRWMRPSRRATELLFRSNSLRVHYQPKGVVGVIATWNFPVYLALGPVAAALAAGNRVMLKMPETTPATNAVVKQLLAGAFAEDHVALVGEVLEDPAEFTALPFDHLVFTGSPAVGRRVMRQASEHLVPLTLELGGKSPALVLRDYPLAQAARSIAHGKGTNAGQICVSPDYALVPSEQVEAFVTAVGEAFRELYGRRPDRNPDYTAVATERHADRLEALLQDAQARGGVVTACAVTADRRRMPLHVVTGCTPDMALMREEIFGPILPVVPYDTLDEAIAFIASRPRPLALYCFGHDTRARDQVLRRTHSGGVTFNDWGWHVVNHDAPFGGIGNSGMGSYHGEEGFRSLSHARTVFRLHRFFPGSLFRPPHGRLLQRLAFAWFLGRPWRP